MAINNCGVCQRAACGQFSAHTDIQKDILLVLCGVLEAGGEGTAGGATEATLLTRASEATLATRASEATQQAVLAAIIAQAADSSGPSKTVVSAANGLNFATLNDAIEVDTLTAASAAIQIVEAYTGTATFEGSIGSLGGNDFWFPLVGVDVNNQPVASLTDTQAVVFFDTSTLSKIRVRVSATGSGDVGYIITTSTV